MIYDGEKIKMIYDQPTERLDSYVMHFGSKTQIYFLMSLFHERLWGENYNAQTYLCGLEIERGEQLKLEISNCLIVVVETTRGDISLAF